MPRATPMPPTPIEDTYTQRRYIHIEKIHTHTYTQRRHVLGEPQLQAVQVLLHLEVLSLVGIVSVLSVLRCSMLYILGIRPAVSCWFRCLLLEIHLLYIVGVGLARCSMFLGAPEMQEVQVLLLEIELLVCIIRHTYTCASYIIRHTLGLALGD